MNSAHNIYTYTDGEFFMRLTYLEIIIAIMLAADIVSDVAMWISK